MKLKNVLPQDFRNLQSAEISFHESANIIVGRNGHGKTNLLESLHVGTQGFSPRTRTDAQLIRFGAAASRIAVRGHRATTPVEIAYLPREPRSR